ncbi:type IV toxin-antitoxin system AbiEi family antitoxin [Phytoactinopolyspora endophytica]|uniref:type IV toxin-antitoxin system AbiEi family antitoxin domain-containing protein n=1 Tax=Phytoactinopolyspora endophytica TaxID=1642495 RepID=UPI00101C9DED
MAEQVRAGDLADWLLSHGRTSIDTNDAADLLGVTPEQVRTRLRASALRKQLVSPARGLWIPVPAQYRTWGAPPGIHFIEDLMLHLGREYYVGWLSAAEIHGAAHQRPQVFQVAVDARLAARAVGRTRFDFVTRAGLQGLPRVRHHVPTGYVWLATPEVTALDLCDDLRRAAGLSNAATVLAELVEDGVLDMSELARVSLSFPVAAGRRVGWLLDLVAPGIDVEALSAAVRRRSEVPSLLRPDRPERGSVDSRWCIRVNAEVEPDL